MHFMPTFLVEFIRWIKFHQLRIIEISDTLYSTIWYSRDFCLSDFASSKYPFSPTLCCEKPKSSMNVMCESTFSRFLDLLCSFSYKWFTIKVNFENGYYLPLVMNIHRLFIQISLTSAEYFSSICCA